MIHKNAAFGNLITTNKLTRLLKQQKILLRTPVQNEQKITKVKKVNRSISFKTELYPLLHQTPKKPAKSPMLLKPPLEKNALKRLPSKPAAFDQRIKSEKSFTSSQRRSSTNFQKITRRWSFEISNEKEKRLSQKAPKTLVKFHQINEAKAKKKKVHLLRMQYKFLSRLRKNKMQKIRSKSLPLGAFIKMRHRRAKTVIEDFHEGPINGLDDQLNRKIAILTIIKKQAMRRQTCFQVPKKSVLVSKEKLINYQKQITEKLQQETDSQFEGSPAMDSLRAYQRRVNFFSDRKQSLKIPSLQKKSIVSEQLKKQQHSIITSYIVNKTSSITQENQSLSFKPLNEYMQQKQQYYDKNITNQISSDRTHIKRRPNLMIRLYPYLQRQSVK